MDRSAAARVAPSLVLLGFAGGLFAGVLRGAWAVDREEYIAARFFHLSWLELRSQATLGVLLGLAAAAVGVLLDAALARAFPAAGRSTAAARFTRLVVPSLVPLVAAGVVLTLSGWEQGALVGLTRKRGLVGLSVAALALAGAGLGLRADPRRGGAAVRAFAAAAMATAALLLLAPLATAAAPPARAKSILLVTVDTLRADHLSLYDYPRDTTPRLRAHASRGRVFSSAYSHAPATGSALASLMTGLLPRDSGSFNNEPLPAPRHALAEYLAEAGYRTAAIVGNFVLRRGRGFEAGFQWYDDRFLEHEPGARALPERTAENTTRDALAWLERHGSRPFFLWVHYQDPHGPYRPPVRYRALFDDGRDSPRLPLNASLSGERGIPSYQVLDGRSDSGYYVAQYDGEIRYVDDQLGELFSGVQRLGLGGSLVTVLTADHGESMGERDYFFAHGQHLYPGLLHVPLAIWNDQSGCPPRNDAIVQHLDVAPTLLAIAGVRPRAKLPGRDLRDCGVRDAAVLSEAAPGQRYQGSLLTRRVQVVYGADERRVLAFDPSSKREIPEQDAVAIGEVDALTKTLRGLAKQVGPRGAEVLSEREREIMRSLGYIQ